MMYAIKETSIWSNVEKNKEESQEIPKYKLLEAKNQW